MKLASILVVIVVAQTLAACGSINTIGFHAPYIEDRGVPTKRARDGIAFPVGDICLHVSESGSKSIQPRAMTLVGLPVIPVGLSADNKQVASFDVSLWLIPESGNNTFTFDVPRIEIEFSNGARRTPSVIQVSRFRTEFEYERVYAFKPDLVETITYPEHWGAKPANDFREPIELWDWTRLNIRFEKPDATLEPTKLYVFGLLKNGEQQEIPTVMFSFVSETRQAFPGRFADGTSLSDWPDRACRGLQAQEKNDP